MARQSPWRRAHTGWLSFWFGTPAPYPQLALIRIGASLVLLYVLFVRSFDLAAPFSLAELKDPALLGTLDPIAWPFSVFNWVDGPVWMWSMHVLAILVATVLLLGVLTPLMALASLFFQLSYAHANPLMLVGVDGLLMFALFYLSLVPSGRVLSVLALREPEPPMRMSYHPERVWEPEVISTVWSTFPVRVLQIHLCLLYFDSALGKLSGDWLTGVGLWHPRLIEQGATLSLPTLVAHPWLTTAVTVTLLLFELFYGALIWLPRLRYGVLAAALLVHLSVGWVWNLLPFNLLMVVLNLAFLPTGHVQALLDRIRPLLVLPWMTSE